MKRSTGNQTADSLIIQAREEDLGPAIDFVEDYLERNGVSGKKATETQLVFEALVEEILNCGLEEGTSLQISGRKTFGNVRIVVGFEGKMFVLSRGSEQEDSPGRAILDAMGDRLQISYHSGYNTVRITAERGYHNSLSTCVAAAVLAALAYLPISLLVSPDDQRTLLEGYVVPLEQLYVNAVLMVGAPLTFLSLLKNLTETYVVSEKNLGFGWLQIRTLGTSAFAILLAFAASGILFVVAGGLQGIESAYGGSGFERSFAEIVVGIIPSSIFEPFELWSPIPLIVLALLVTYALCSAGEHFDALKGAVDACYRLFSQMLRAVMRALPGFCFIAPLDILLDYDYDSLLEVMVFIAFVAVSLVILLASYAVRLRVRGIAVGPFVRKLVPLLRENFKIGSAIDAAPFNIRYCAANYGMERARIEKTLPVLAQINLDGNCFIIMLFSLTFVFVAGTPVTVFSLAMIAVIVLLLSFGAPNQPGGILIGSLIIVTYLQATYGLLPLVIFAEAFFCDLQNLVNVTGDIVMAAIDDRSHRE